MHIDSEGTYWERVQRIARMLYIGNAFVTDQQALEAKRRIEAAGGVAAVQRMGEKAPETLRRDALVVENVLHPDTGLPVSPFFLRLSFIVPANCFLDACMIMARGTWPVVAAQALNQTYNAAHYYALRNATRENSRWRLGLSYALATGSAVGAALSVNRLSGRLGGGVASVVLRRVSPFLAVAAADVLNLAVMRQDEWRFGVVVKDPQTGQELGQSRVAGAMAVGACVTSRVCAAAPVLLSSSFAHHLLSSSPLFRHRPFLKLSLTLAALASAIQIAVPLVFAIFRQDARAPAQWIEPSLNIPKHITHVQYHKGL